MRCRTFNGKTFRGWLELTHSSHMVNRARAPCARHLMTHRPALPLLPPVPVPVPPRRHIDGPLGVRGRTSNNTRIATELDWQPSATLQAGLEATYPWILAQVEGFKKEGRHEEL